MISPGVYGYVTQWSTCWQKCTEWHLAFVCSIIYSSFILDCKHTTHAISMLTLPITKHNLSYQVSQCANLNVSMYINFHFEYSLVMVNSFMFTVSICDTLRPLGTQLRPFPSSVRDSKRHILCNLLTRCLYYFCTWCWSSIAHNQIIIETKCSKHYRCFSP